MSVGRGRLSQHKAMGAVMARSPQASISVSDGGAAAGLQAGEPSGPGEEEESREGGEQRGAKEKKKNKGKPFSVGVKYRAIVYGKGSLIISTWSGVLLPIVSFSYIYN